VSSALNSRQISLLATTDILVVGEKLFNFGVILEIKMEQLTLREMAGKTISIKN